MCDGWGGDVTEWSRDGDVTRRAGGEGSGHVTAGSQWLRPICGFVFYGLGAACTPRLYRLLTFR